MRRVLIGVDGGGTKTNLLALDAAAGKIIGSASTGGIHAGDTGIENAIDNLKKGISALGLSAADSITGISLGDPAIDDRDGDSEAGEALRKEAERLCAPGGGCFSKSDVFMALYAFSGGRPAAFLVAGTGSMGIALKQPYRHGEKNDVITVGGRGNPTYDPGSAYSIAVAGICAAVNAFDGIDRPTALCERILPFFRAESHGKLTGILNGSALSRSQVAAFAKEVDTCASGGDEVAGRILFEAGCTLAKYACRLLEGVKEPQIGIYGSVLLCNQTVRRVFEQQLKAAVPEVRICRPDAPPEYGAALFAADALCIDRRNWQ